MARWTSEVAKEDDGDVVTTKAWARKHFEPGCLIGDLARQEGLTVDEFHMLTCALEGWLAAGGEV